jgi:hypothetical protein
MLPRRGELCFCVAWPVACVGEEEGRGERERLGCVSEFPFSASLGREAVRRRRPIPWRMERWARKQSFRPVYGTRGARAARAPGEGEGGALSRGRTVRSLFLSLSLVRRRDGPECALRDGARAPDRELRRHYFHLTARRRVSRCEPSARVEKEGAAPASLRRASTHSSAALLFVALRARCYSMRENWGARACVSLLTSSFQQAEVARGRHGRWMMKKEQRRRWRPSPPGTAARRQCSAAAPQLCLSVLYNREWRRCTYIS